VNRRITAGWLTWPFAVSPGEPIINNDYAQIKIRANSEEINIPPTFSGNATTISNPVANHISPKPALNLLTPTPTAANPMNSYLYNPNLQPQYNVTPSLPYYAAATNATTATTTANAYPPLSYYASNPNNNINIH
jgi:hypothetical protein